MRLNICFLIFCATLWMVQACVSSNEINNFERKLDTVSSQIDEHEESESHEYPSVEEDDLVMAITSPDQLQSLEESFGLEQLLPHKGLLKGAPWKGPLLGAPSEGSLEGSRVAQSIRKHICNTQTHLVVVQARTALTTSTVPDRHWASKPFKRAI